MIMKSGSWASYLAAMPPECRGEPDDDGDEGPPTRFFFACGCLASDPGNAVRDEQIEWACDKHEAEFAAAEERDRRECEEVMARVWAEEAERLRTQCQWCGAPVPDGGLCDPCRKEEAWLKAGGDPAPDSPPFESDMIPW